jgi:hypothetical protein
VSSSNFGSSSTLQLKIEYASSIWFKGSNFVPWIQTLCVFIMMFSRHLLLFKLVKFATCTCMSWCFGSSKFSTIVHHGIKDVVQIDETIYMFLFRGTHIYSSSNQKLGTKRWSDLHDFV